MSPKQRGQVIGQLIGRQVCPGRDHPATDVDTDCGWDESSLHEGNAADGGADPDVRRRA